MSNSIVRLKGYRCFGHDHFAEVALRPGVTALVGANNSGKSTLMRAFYELKPVLHLLTDAHTIVQLQNGHRVGVPTAGIEDHAEIFNDRSEEPVRIEVDIPFDGQSTLRAALISDRSEPGQWRAEFFYDEVRLTAVEPIHLKHFGDFGKLIDRTRYVGPYRNIISESRGVYYDVEIGTAFIGTWADMKTGGTRMNNVRCTELTDTMAEIFGFRRLEINATQDRNNLQVIVDGRPYRLRELGAGFAQFFHALVTTALGSASFLFIDEPEGHLHPTLQIKLMSTLQQYVSEGVVMATHSLGLARSVATSIVSLHREGDGVKVRPFEDARTPTELLGELSFASFQDVGVETVLFVEGKHDLGAIRDWIRRMEGEKRIVVLPLSGATNITKQGAADLVDVRRLATRIAVLVDSERIETGGEIARPRREFVETCLNAGINVHVTDLRSIENYFSQTAIDEVLGPGYSQLGPFEALARSEKPWDKGRNWQIASAMTMEEVRATDVGAFLAKL